MTFSPASRPSLPWGMSRMPSAFRKEDTTPAPRASGEATSLSPTRPSRTRTNSRYFSPDTTRRASTASACSRAGAFFPVQLSIKGRSRCSSTRIPLTG